MRRATARQRSERSVAILAPASSPAFPFALSDPALAPLVARAAELADFCADRAPEIDRDDAFPDAEFARIAAAGLLAAPLPRAHGGADLGIAPGATLPLLQILAHLGRGNLAVGRLYEGHVNALHLLHRFGTAAQLAAVAADVRERAALLGVWNTEGAGGVRLVPERGAFRMEGAKTFASGAGHVARPLVTGALPDGGWQMCLVPMERARAAIDPASWRPLGMRASASYRVAFDGTTLAPGDLIGAPGDYYRQPWFSGGAIRFAAVQLGGAQALLDATRAYLRGLGRTDDPYQRARVGEMAIAAEGGALWLRGAADRADRSPFVRGGAGADEAFVAYVNMARTAIERACLDAMRLAEQAVGARGLLPPHPIERIVRDLTLYLRQPAPDAALADAGRYALAAPGRADALWAGDDG